MCDDPNCPVCTRSDDANREISKKAGEIALAITEVMVPYYQGLDDNSIGTASIKALAFVCGLLLGRCHPGQRMLVLNHFCTAVTQYAMQEARENDAKTKTEAESTGDSTVSAGPTEKSMRPPGSTVH